MAKRNLTDFVEQVTGGRHLRVENDLGDGFVVLRATEAQRRQAAHDIRGTEDIVIEMLRNSRDAHASNIFLALSREGDTRRITMIDDGDGVPDHLHDRIFDARVTSKLDSMHVDVWGVHGRGMALYAVRENSQKAYVAASKVGGGTSIVVETDTKRLPEKVDQSSMPTFVRSDSGAVAIRGTRNIFRMVAEFTYVDHDSCTVYVGSPVEIAATLWSFGKMLLPRTARVFCESPERIDVCKRLALASDPTGFAELSASIGLELSERSARRIMDGEVEAVAPFSDLIDTTVVKTAGKGSDKSAARTSSKSVKLSKNDAARFKSDVLDAFQSIAQSYYLVGDVDVSLTVRNDAIHLTIPIRRID